MRNELLAKSILNLYQTVTDNSEVSFRDIENNFSSSKINEPLVHSSKLYGKVPTNRHVLEDEFEEILFQESL